MIRLLLPVVLIALGSLPGHAQAPSERGAGPIHIDAVALDRNGLPVMDLKPAEVEVWIGHFRVPIESFTVVTPDANPSGRLTVLMLDDVTVSLQHIGRVRDVAKRFVTTMRPEDRIAFISLDGSSMEATNDSARLLRTIDAYTAQSRGMMPAERLGEHVLKNLAALSKQMVEAGGQRKTIVALGSSWLFDRPIPPAAVGMEPRKEWIAAMQAMAVANVGLYVIDPSGVSVTRTESGTAGFARETGGIAYTATNDLNGAADKIMREASNYYMLGVGDPPVGRGADLRAIDVKVLRRGVTVRARHLITGGT